MQLTLVRDLSAARNVAELLRAHLTSAREVTPPRFVLCGPFGQDEPSATSPFMTFPLTALLRDAGGGDPAAER